ncbi:subclass B1 metallo-beta-lactamase [Microscilla marina]|uniref:beta-lactamase n=1 Tax=Microscilla marina ATCC 23134 TaxID=313606 RepID=A1ZR42_MICM2|nr:subclass B1 metallo-beta-lactamase [Microscilla marina]EAY27131.1 beta-lactamase II [Microscilla marina ATCC 23134]
MTKLTTTCFVLALSLLSYACYAQKIKVKKLEKNVYVHISYKKMGNTNVPSNGLIVKTNKGVWIIDTAWDDDQTKQIIGWVKKNLKKPIQQVIITHAHDDRAGGIQAFLDEKIPVTSTQLTAKRTVKSGLPSPQPVLKKSQVIDCGNNNLEIFSPGWGHAPDNIVVYLTKQKVLFGGCFIKSTDTRKLGNTKDAHLKLWKKGLLKVQSKFKEVETVVPGHQDWGDGRLITHTMDLLDVSLHR